MKQLITGIQQVGIGVSNCLEAKYFYKDIFGMNILVFDDKAAAELMKQYTGDCVHTRHALLTMNLAGGGGFEIWQFTSRNPESYNAQFGDIGIFSAKIKCRDIEFALNHFKKDKKIFTSELMHNPSGQSHFWVKDLYGNFFDVAENNHWFKRSNAATGGTYGASIGVSDMNESLKFYKNLLGIDEVIYDTTSAFNDLPHDSQGIFRRVLLRKKKSLVGAFTNLLGGVEIELVQRMDNNSNKIFHNRYWGDCGFIHLCFDVIDMDELKNLATTLGYTFTVDSKDSYAMETAEGRFCYVEDPDGTLIELVETHKIPVIKKMKWHINLKNRKKQAPLPNWMINMLGLNKVK